MGGCVESHGGTGIVGHGLQSGKHLGGGLTLMFWPWCTIPSGEHLRSKHHAAFVDFVDADGASTAVVHRRLARWRGRLHVRLAPIIASVFNPSARPK
jgi:hypothetical protein